MLAAVHSEVALEQKTAALGHLVDANGPKDRWAVERSLSGGGQGVTFYARRLTDGQDGCLKVLKQQGDLNRRQRFFAEANALAGIAHPRVARLIETNARQEVVAPGNGAPKLYLVTEFIAGPTLDAAIEAGLPSTAEALALAEAVAETLQALHPYCLHRDIKPENLVLRGGAFDDPVLVDFGLSATEEIGPHTAIGEEIGNRFLRLPELAPGSQNKRSTATDVTFTAALLFFALTGQRPGVLVGADGAMPHQRADARERLNGAVAINVNSLLDLFDKAFQPDLAKRFQTADDLLAALRQMRQIPPGGPSPQDFLLSLWPRVDGITPEESMIMQQRCRRVVYWAQQIVYEVKPLPVWIRATMMAGGCAVHGSRSAVCQQVGFEVFDESTGSQRGVLMPHLVAEVKGKEIILTGLYNGLSEVVLRLARDPFRPAPEDVAAVEAYFVRCLQVSLASGNFRS